MGHTLRSGILLIASALVLASCSILAGDTSTIEPNDPLYPHQSSLPAIKAPAAWAHNTGSSSTQIAVIDSGITPIDDLAPNLDPGVSCSPGCTLAKAEDKSDHGTPVAALIGAVGNNDLDMAGVSWSSRIVPVKVEDDRGAATTQSLNQAISWITKQHIPLANLSIIVRKFDPALERAFKTASNTLFVVPAGNDGSDIDTRDIPVYPCRLLAPNVICVAAGGLDGTLSPASNWGAHSVDLVAPGENLLTLSVDGNPIRKSGTSFATALVTGAAAILLAQRPGSTPQEIKFALSCGTNMEDQLRNKVAAGYLNIEAAMDCLMSAP